MECDYLKSNLRLCLFFNSRMSFLLVAFDYSSHRCLQAFHAFKLGISSDDVHLPPINSPQQIFLSDLEAIECVFKRLNADHESRHLITEDSATAAAAFVNDPITSLHILWLLSVCLLHCLSLPWTIIIIV